MDRIAELLEKQIALDLHFRGVPQGDIARFLKKGKVWVNEQLKCLPAARDR